VDVGTNGFQEREFMDAVYLGVTLLFFALSWGLLVLCERL
jgi:hypothetical protein